MTEADIAVIIATGGSVAAGAWQTLKGIASYLTPKFEKMIEAMEATARSTQEHSTTLMRMETSNNEAKTVVFGDHKRIEDLARETLVVAKSTEKLCERILAEVMKEHAA